MANFEDALEIAKAMQNKQGWLGVMFMIYCIGPHNLWSFVIGPQFFRYASWAQDQIPVWRIANSICCTAIQGMSHHQQSLWTWMLFLGILNFMAAERHVLIRKRVRDGPAFQCAVESLSKKLGAGANNVEAHVLIDNEMMLKRVQMSAVKLGAGESAKAAAEVIDNEADEDDEDDEDDKSSPRTRQFDLLDDPLKAILCAMLRYVVPAVMHYIFLMPNYQPEPILGFLRSSSNISDIQLLMATLLTLVPAKVPECLVNIRNTVVNLLFNFMVHKQINIVTNNLFKNEAVAPGMVFFLALLAFVVNKCYLIRPSGNWSNFAALVLFRIAALTGQFEEGKPPSTAAVACFVFALGTVMFLDGIMAQWPNCETLLCHLLAVPPSSLYSAYCYDPADKPLDYCIAPQFLELLQTYELYAKTWVLMILIVNMVFFFTLCKRGKKRVNLAKKLANWRVNRRSILEDITKVGKLAVELQISPHTSLCEVLQKIPWSWSAFVFLWCIVEFILPKSFQLRQMRISFGLRGALTSDTGALNDMWNWASRMGQSETGSNSSFFKCSF